MKVTWQSGAYRDLASQLEYLAARNPWAAYDMDQAIEKAVRNLTDHPDMGRPGRLPGTRELVVPRTPYLVVYKAEPDAIVVVRLLHGSIRWIPR